MATYVSWREREAFQRFLLGHTVPNEFIRNEVDDSAFKNMAVRGWIRPVMISHTREQIGWRITDLGYKAAHGQAD